MQKVEMVVRGKTRTVYLEKKNSDGSWLARTYTGTRGRTTVSGIFRKSVTGARRFTPTGVNANLI